MDSSSTASEDRCFICGDDNLHRLQTHHIVPRRFGGSDQPENLVKLCGSCHQAIEKLYDDSFYERLGARTDTEELQTFPSDGTIVDESESLDREIPQKSPHVRFELEPIERDPENIPDVEEQLDPESDWNVSGAGAKTSEVVRIHCGYCPTVFAACEHAKAARHLRVHHFIEDPYETPSTDKDLFDH